MWLPCTGSRDAKRTCLSHGSLSISSALEGSYSYNNRQPIGLQGFEIFNSSIFVTKIAYFRQCIHWEFYHRDHSIRGGGADRPSVQPPLHWNRLQLHLASRAKPVQGGEASREIKPARPFSPCTAQRDVHCRAGHRVNGVISEKYDLSDKFWKWRWAALNCFETSVKWSERALSCNQLEAYLFIVGFLQIKLPG